MDPPLYDRNAAFDLDAAVRVSCGRHDVRRRVLRDSNVLPLVEGSPALRDTETTSFAPTVVVPAWAAYPLMDWCPANEVPGNRRAKGVHLLRISSPRLMRLLRAFAADPEARAVYSTLRRLNSAAAVAFALTCAPTIAPNCGTRWRPKAR